MSMAAPRSRAAPAADKSLWPYRRAPAGRPHRPGHLRHPRHHVGRVLVHLLHQAVRAAEDHQARAARARTELLAVRRTCAKAPTKLEKNSAYRQIVDDGLLAQEQHDKLTDPIDQHDWMVQLARPQPGRDHVAVSASGLAFLATVGSTAPFVGLFGTVIGIYPRADPDRRGRPGVDRRGRRPGRRSADHDRARPRRRGAGGACSTTG